MTIRQAMTASLLALALAGCGDRQAQQQAQAAAQAQAREQAATQLQREFDAAVQGGNWELARVHGVALLDQYPGTPAAEAVEPALAEVRSRADAAREQRRLAGLWNYARVAAGKGEQRSASIFSSEPLDTGAGAARPVQLVFRDHPDWKRSAYLVLENGDFDCYGGCRLQVGFGGTTRAMSAWRPRTDEAIALFIEDHKGLWKRLDGAGTLSIAIPLKGAGTRTVEFEVDGLDRTQLQGWD